MMKKLVSLAMATALAFSVVACGNSGSGNTDAPDAANDGAADDVQATEGSDDQTAESGDQAAAGGAAFKIGGIGPMTGAASAYGTAVMNATKIAVDEINAAGGVNGYQLEFNPQDDEHDPEKSVNAYNTLKRLPPLLVSQLRQRLPTTICFF